MTANINKSACVYIMSAYILLYCSCMTLFFVVYSDSNLKLDFVLLINNKKMYLIFIS